MAWDLKDYEPVEDRLRAFWSEHPEGRVNTDLIHIGADGYIVKASVWRGPNPDGLQSIDPDSTGYASEAVTERGVNSTSALENCETSAIGRALANLGYAAKGKRPSREEMQKSASVEPAATGPEGSVDHVQGAGGKAEVGGSGVQSGVSPDPAREESAPYGEGGADSHDPEAGTVAASDGGRESSGAAPALLSSQAKQLLRHAVSLRWGDDDISAAVAEAYPGLGAIGELSQEQARALIDEWRKLVAATRITKEQRDRIKPLATNTDAARRAQVLFGADHIKNVGDLTMAEAEALISDLEATRAGAA